MLDTCHKSQVVDCEAYGCRDWAMPVWEWDDWQSRGGSGHSSRIQDGFAIVPGRSTISACSINMDCSKAKGAYGLVARTGRPGAPIPAQER